MGDIRIETEAVAGSGKQNRRPIHLHERNTDMINATLPRAKERQSTFENAVLDLLVEAVLDGRVMASDEVSVGTLVNMLCDVVIEMDERFGTPTAVETVGFCAALAAKLHGRATEADATFAGLAVTIADAEDVDGMEAYSIAIGDDAAVYAVNWGAEKMLLQ